MSNRFDFRRCRLAAVALATVFAFAAVPSAGRAAPVDLATVEPFVVLAGTAVTNEGSSVLNGDLGVSPGTALTGFTFPTVVNGVSHENSAVAAQAQLDLTNAYNVAAGQPVPPGNVLTGNLGNRTLAPGAYEYSSDAILAGPLRLDAEGDPDAQFVFEIGSQLTTESGSSVVLINKASACNVHWQVGSSADLGTTTAFQGNLMALSSISLKSGATVIGRMLARNGQVSLIDNVLGTPNCATGSDETATGSTPVATVPTATTGTATTGTPPTPGARAKARNAHRRGGSASLGRGRVGPRGIRATVRGRRIERVRFSIDGKRVGGRSGSARSVTVPARPGTHVVVARVSFGDDTPATRMSSRFRVPYPVFAPPRGPSRFTG